MAQKVSIIIPVYNGANYLKEAIDSAISQTYDNIEIIVVNDGSTDDGETRKVAEEYGDRIRYFEKENGGCASALNYGISKMTGQWFSWLSHDDLYFETKIEKSLRFAVDNHLDDGKHIINCSTKLINEFGKDIFHPVKSIDGFLDCDSFFSYLLFGQSLNGCALLIPKEAIDAVGCFDEGLTYIPDFDYWVRLSLFGMNLNSFKDCLCMNRVHSKQVSVRKKDTRIPDLKKEIVKIEELLFEKKDYGKVHILWKYAYSKGFRSEAKLIKAHLKYAKSPIRFSEIFKTSFLKIYLCIKGFIKKIYKIIFKKGMD